MRAVGGEGVAYREHSLLSEPKGTRWRDRDACGSSRGKCEKGKCKYCRKKQRTSLYNGQYSENWSEQSEEAEDEVAQKEDEWTRMEDAESSIDKKVMKR
jgi:hypothetical protein